MKHTTLFFGSLLLVGMMLGMACGSGTDTDGTMDSDSIMVEIPDSVPPTYQPPVEVVPPAATKGMEKAENTEVKSVTIPPCTAVQKKAMAKWREEISGYQAALADATDPDEKMGITQSLNDAKKALTDLEKIYNCKE